MLKKFINSVLIITFFLYGIYTQQNITYNVGILIEPPLISIANPLNYDPNNTTNSDFNGILIDLFDYIATNLNFTYNLNVVSSKNLLTNDIVLYAPADYNFDKGFDPVYFYLKNVTINYLRSNEVIKESYYIFYPSLLVTLIQRVIWELFFILFIVIIPWVLLNAQIYYLFDSSKYRDLPFYKGFYKALSSIVFRESETKCGKIYSIFFLATTAIVCMLILADFIYTIANMLTRYDITNVYDLINNKANICLFLNDYFQINFLDNISEIQLTTKANIGDCFVLIENLGVDALLISEFYIKFFLKNNSQYNNLFRYYVKQNSFKSYAFLIQNKLNEENQTFLSNVLKKYHN